MTKNEYREFFAKCRPFLKFSYFCRLTGVQPISISRFMKGEEWNYEMSPEKLQLFYAAICDALDHIA